MSRWLLILLLVTAGCANGPDSFPLPDRSDVIVQQEEARVARVLVADTGGRVLASRTGRRCTVRLLRKTSDTAYVWADCDAASGEGSSLPVRVRGTEVTTPGDGSAYGSSVKEIVPKDIAEALLDDPERYRP